VSGTFCEAATAGATTSKKVPDTFLAATQPHQPGGMFSVALSLGSLRVAVSDHRALPSSDFPPGHGPRRGDRAIASPTPPAALYHKAGNGGQETSSTRVAGRESDG